MNHPPPSNPSKPSSLAHPPRASMATYKRELRKQIKKRLGESEKTHLNLVAMLDMTTMLLIFTLMASSTSTSIPDSEDLKMPRSILQTEASEEGVHLFVSRSHIMVGDDEICPVPSNATRGVEGRYKRGGANDLYIVPLANTLQVWRERDRQIRLATGKDPSSSEAIIIADGQTPYRLLTEVLFTLGQSEFGKYHLMVFQGKKK